MVQLRDRGHHGGGHDPLGEDRQATEEAAQRVDTGQQTAGTQTAARSPQVGIHRSTSAGVGKGVDTGRGRDLPSLQPEVLTDGVPAIDGAALGVATHDPTGSGMSTRAAPMLTAVASRPSPPSSTSSTAALRRPPEPASSTVALVTIGPTRPRAR